MPGLHIVDMAISATHAPAYAEASRRRPLGCATARESRKISEHQQSVLDAGNTFTPFVFETFEFGAMGPRAKALFQAWIQQAPVQAQSEGEIRLRGILSEQWQRRFSITLQRGNARVILSRSRLARSRMGVRVYGHGRRQSELDDGTGEDLPGA